MKKIFTFLSLLLATSAMADTPPPKVTVNSSTGLSISGQVISLQTATGSVPGSLSAANWTTFNAKQPAGSYCVTTNNLSDLANASTARTNLGLGSHALLNSLVSGDIPNNAANTSGNAGTATALAANGGNCSAGAYPKGVDASGAAESCTAVSLTADVSGTLPNGNTTASASAGNSTIVSRDGSGNFAAGTITAALAGNASTATALAADPADCSANQVARGIIASGVATCSALASGDLPAISHASLTNLTSADDHTQYAALAGRAGSQTLIGGTASGEDLILSSTSNGTKGQIYIGANTFMDEATEIFKVRGTTTNQDLFSIKGSGGNEYLWGIQSGRLYMYQGSNTYFVYSGGWTSYGIAGSAPRYAADFNYSSTSTSPLTEIVQTSGAYNNPLVAIRNTSGTVNSYSGIVLGGGTTTQEAGVHILGVYESVTAGSETAHLDINMRDAGTITNRLRLSKSGALTLSNYGAGYAMFDSGGAITSVAKPGARAHASSTAISGTLATIVWDTEDWDTASALASGVFTCPVVGKYQVNAFMALSGTFVLNNTAVMELQVNSTAVATKTVYLAGAVTNADLGISDIVNCASISDTVRIQVSSSGTGPAVVSSNVKNWISIQKVD